MKNNEKAILKVLFEVKKFEFTSFLKFEKLLFVLQFDNIVDDLEYKWVRHDVGAQSVCFSCGEGFSNYVKTDLERLCFLGYLKITKNGIRTYKLTSQGITEAKKCCYTKDTAVKIKHLASSFVSKRLDEILADHYKTFEITSYCRHETIC